MMQHRMGVCVASLGITMRACAAMSSHIPMAHADLVPREVAEMWLKHLREELPAVAFKCNTQQQASSLGQRQMHRDASAALTTASCLGECGVVQAPRSARGRCLVVVPGPCLLVTRCAMPWCVCRTCQVDCTSL